MNSRKKYCFLFLIGFIHFIHCDTSESDLDLADENYDGETRQASSDESEYYLKFINKLSNYTKPIRKSFTLKCEVSLTNFYSDYINASSHEDFQNITENVLHKVKIHWFKNKTPIETSKRIVRKKNVDNGTVISTLKFRNLEILDKSIYTCIASIGKNKIESSGYLNVIQKSEDEDKILPPYKPLFTKSDSGPEATLPSSVTEIFLGFGFTQQNFTPKPFPKDDEETDDAITKISNAKTFTKNLKSTLYPSQGLCQIYTGLTCAEFLDKEYVYIPYPATQAALEDKLTMAFKVVSYSNEISASCRRYALPSLCYSTFPICRSPNETNALFREHFHELSESSNKIQKNIESSEDTEDRPVLKVRFENMPPGGLPPHLSPREPIQSKESTRSLDSLVRGKRHTSEIEYHIDTRTKKVVPEDVRLDRHTQFTISRSSIPLRRVCREDCIIIENELCQKEYAIAKRHPEIGQKLTLEDCSDLPDSADCLEIEIEKHISADTCYWETGIHYRGNVSISKSGRECIKWSEQFIHKMGPELLGGHNYCRNPGGRESQPWCFVADKDNIYEQLCDIPNCSQKLWIYIIMTMVTVSVLFFLFVTLLCCKQRNSKNNTAAIRNINLPNADKNIYGNSRLNSPIELNELLAGQNTNSRTNGILRVPQYTLSQIKFVDELGEGAFGKVYKGELSKDNQTIFVAVKALKENASYKTQQDFKREIELISELRHDNIVCILGVVLREEPLCMLFEFMAKGDLHEFLMEKAPPEGSGLSPTQFLLIAKHIAAGMEYLAAHHYVHRDLAARNCLVADNLVVKISDFGLSRDIYSSDYYRVQSKSLLPVRWMPPESILYGKFTTESDVWSYGVVLWEVYSYGLQPYYGYSNQEVISMVRGRQLLQCPTDCPRTVYALMKECWHQTPSKRPDFTIITQRLSGWLRPNGGLYCDMTSDSSGATSSQRAPLSTGDPRERIPLIGNHSSSNGSLATSTTMPRKHSTAGSVRSHTSGRLMMSSSDVTSSSDNCDSNNMRLKKSSCGSLLDSTDRGSQRDTVVKIPTLSQPYDI